MEKPMRIPTCLFESLEEICWRFDNKFIEDVSHIIGIPASDIKRKILGVRGTHKLLLYETGPWWQESACPTMVLDNGGLWRRCSKLCESDGYCKKHNGRHGLRYDDPYFESLIKRYPFKWNGEIVWVAEDGSVLTRTGELLKNISINIHNGIAHECIHKHVDETKNVHSDAL